jgi:hypothetical protein
VRRIRTIPSVLPFATRYREGIWLLPDGLRPTYDESVETIDADSLPFDSDIKMHSTWSRLVDQRYLPDSYYRFLQALHRTRKDATAFVSALSSVIEGVRSGCRH